MRDKLLNEFLMKKEKRKKEILVAFSGGIDSTASAVLLKNAGYDITGVFFIFFEDKESVKRAERVASSIEINLIKKDLSKDFKEIVIDHFVSEYKGGRTPNPCVLCNPNIKFQKLIECADELEIKNIATGHYACVAKKDQQFFELRRANDKNKDQSYFLYRLSQQQLSRIKFPLCKWTKEKAKEMLENENIVIREKESQDVCFFRSQEKLKDFLSKYIKEKHGNFIDEDGEKVGDHDGAHFFTIGQRRGLDINGGPYFVIGKERKKNIVFVSKRKDHPALLSRRILIENVHWISEEPNLKKKYQIKTRYLSEKSVGSIDKKNDNWIVELDDAQWGVAPGQSLVVYDGNIVVGGGEILSKIIPD